MASAKWSDAEFIGAEASLNVVEVVEDGNRVTITAEVGGKGFTGPSTFAFVQRGDHVARMEIRA